MPQGPSSPTNLLQASHFTSLSAHLSDLPSVNPLPPVIHSVSHLDDSNDRTPVLPLLDQYQQCQVTHLLAAPASAFAWPTTDLLPQPCLFFFNPPDTSLLDLSFSRTALTSDSPAHAFKYSSYRRKSNFLA